MGEYEVSFTRSARKELESLDSQTARRIFEKIVALANEPRPRGALKLSGTDNLYRLRVGDYRVIYAIDDQQAQVEVTAVRHRRDAYR